MDNLDIIEQFRRLSPEKQYQLAVEFGVHEGNESERYWSQWLLRIENKKLMGPFGKRVQEVS